MRICDNHGLNVAPAERKLAFAVVQFPRHYKVQMKQDVCQECFADMFPAGLEPGMTITILNDKGDIV